MCIRAGKRDDADAPPVGAHARLGVRVLRFELVPDTADAAARGGVPVRIDDVVQGQQAAYPDAELLIHPECGCSSKILGAIPELQLYSTEGMIHRAKASPAQEFIVVHRPGRKDWSLPKGKIDAGEHVLAAARKAEVSAALRMLPPAIFNCRARKSKRKSG